MKKFFVFAIAALCMVSCGKKAEEAKANEAETEQTEQTLEEKAKYYAQEIAAAQVAGNQERLSELAAEIEEWGATLSDEEKATVEQIVEAELAAAAETVDVDGGDIDEATAEEMLEEAIAAEAEETVEE